MSSLVVRFAVTAFAVCALAAADLSGTYKGIWAGGMADGDITITVTPGQDGPPKAEVSFTVQGQNVKCNVTSFKVDGSKVELVYDFDLGDTQLESTATGELKGDSLSGTYKTKSLGDGSAVDEGTWKASK